ncbi:CHAT domain-containing protein [Actinokineospora inagensis]|uniref:CHAT domain-containing protein n=1 Tax=Actinokineospora inagensis TaxID=103730 RepID=UPI0006854968|nr:CHAT domain-containing protein [Actinokineospora inagensis]
MADSQAAVLADLGARIARFDRDGHQTEVLDDAAHRAALALYGEVVADRAGGVPVLRVLGRWFLRHYSALPQGVGLPSLRSARLCAGLLRDLDPAALTDDLRAVLSGESDRVTAAHATVVTLLEQFEDTGDHTRVAAAGVLLRSVEAELPADHPLRHGVADAAIQLSSAQLTMHADPADAAALLRAARTALTTLVPDAPGLVDSVNTLAWALLVNYELFGDEAHLREAFTLTERHLRDDRGKLVAHIAVQRAEALRMRFESTNDMADLDLSVALAREAVATAPSGHPIVGALRRVLATCLIRRVEHLDRADDLTEAIELCQVIRPALGPGGPVRAMWSVNESALLNRRARRGGGQTDLDSAVAIAQEALAMSERLDGIRPIALTNLSSALALRYCQHGRREDLAGAIEHIRAAIAATRAGDTRISRLHAQMTMLTAVAAEGGQPGTALDEAIQHGEQALEVLEAGHAQRASALNALAEAHRQRYLAEGDEHDLTTAAALWRTATELPAGNAGSRMTAARSWLEAALRLRDLPGAAEAATAAIRLLPILAERGLDRAGQERRLADVAGLAGQAAALAIHMGNPEHAVELTEQGRTVLWRQAVQTRGDLSVLRAVAPELADRLDGTRRSLTASANDPTSAEHHRRLAARWEELLGQARQLPGFGAFLDTVPFSELRRAAVGGTVVIINVSPARCDALFVRADGVTVVPLPWLRLPDARRRADALAEAGGNPVDLRQTLVSMLRWLWDTTAAPVLAALDTMDGPVRHRVWWCPTGPMALLPLHAAGRYVNSERWRVRRRPTVPDQTVSSYTTGLGALIRSRQRQGRVSRLLAVGVPEREGRAPLPAVVDELTHIAATVPGTRTLLGPDATPAAVLSQLQGHSWVHFACHATQNLQRPGESALHLHGGDLSVLDLAAHDLGAAELAYLSACHTAGGAVALADETVHLAAALQLAGFRHVIATQWPVSDPIAASAAQSLYRQLTASGLRAADAARGLTATSAALRKRYPNEPDSWAPFIHIGP